MNFANFVVSFSFAAVNFGLFDWMYVFSRLNN